MRIDIRSLTIAAALGLALLPGARAAIDRYEFTVNWNQGELAGTRSDGWLSFDSALAQPNAQYSTDVLSGFGFSMRGRTYGVSDVDVGFLQFDVSRQLRLLGVGDDCGPGFCRSNPGHTESFYIVYDSQSQLDRFYGVAGDSTYATSYGPGMMLLAPVPEPGQFSLLLGGLACLGLLVRGRSGAVRDSA